MVRTLKNIIHDIDQFCTDHKQINEFGWGRLTEITTKDHDFVMLWLTPTTSTIEGHMVSLNFDMYVMDIVKQDLSNLLDVVNDTLLIGNDVVSKFWSDEETYGWVLNEANVSAEPFEAKFDDFTSGWIFRISVEIENSLSNCNIPD